MMNSIARLMAIIGGLVLTALIVLTSVSVLGRGGNTFGHSDFLNSIAPGLAEALINTGIGPVKGDFELVEAGIAFAIFAFLPLCQLHGGHATVDVFTSFLRPRINRFLIAFWEVVLTLIIILISWRLFAGLQSKMGNGEITYILQFPVWYGYFASFAASLVSVLIGIYSAGARVYELVSGRAVLPNGGAVH
jgi:hypothetical protein